MHESHVALHEHLCYAGCSAEVAVNLERSVRVPKVVERAVLQQVAVERVGMIAVVQARPLVKFPAHRPSCSAVAAMLEHYARSLSQFGRRNGRHGVARMQTKEMIHVAMLVLRVVDVGRPLHELSVATYLVRSEMLQSVLPLAAFLCALAQHATCLNSIQEHFAYHGVSERCALVNRSVLGRCRRSSGVYAVGAMPEIVGSEVGRLLQHVVVVGEEVAVAGEVVVVPEVSGEPRTGERREVPRHILARKRRCEAEDIARNGCCPATCAEVRLSRYAARLNERAHEVEERQLALRKSRRASQPVVHLQVDVVMIVDAPRSVHVVMPQALQVSRHIVCTRRRDEQVAAKLIVELLQIVVGLALAVSLKASVHGQVGGLNRSVVDVQTHAVEELRIVGVMLVEQRGVVLSRSLCEPVGGSLCRVDAHISLRVVEVGVVVGLVVGVGSDEEHHLVDILHRELAASVRNLAALSHSLDAHGVLHGVIVETRQPAERIGAVGLHLARRNRVWSVREHEVLLAALRRSEAHSHHIGRMRHEILALVLHAVLAETHLSKG